MNFRSIISEKNATSAGFTCRCRSILLMVLAFVCLGAKVQAQEITVTNVVMSIPAGVTVTTEGGITLENQGAIANDGTLELKGDWTNDGKGLLPESKGKVVFNGENQQIGGKHASDFHHLVLAGKGEKNLAADISVAGRLTLQNCAVITHHHAFAILNDHPLNYLWTNAVVLFERPQTLDAAEQACTPVSLPGQQNGYCIVAAAAPATTTANPRPKAGKGNANAVPATFPRMSQNVNDQPSQPLAAKEVLSTGGATAAISTMYFSSEIEGAVFSSTATLFTANSTPGAENVNGSNGITGMTRKLNDHSAPASSFLARNLNGIHQA